MSRPTTTQARQVDPGEPPRQIKAEAVLLRKNQITIPANVVRSLNLNLGDRFLVIAGSEGAEIRLVRLPRSFAGALAGVYGTPTRVKEYLADEQDAWGE